MHTDVPALVLLAEQLAREAGDLVRTRPETVAVAATKSSAADVVTAMDMAAEDLLRRRIAQARPLDGILGEEHGHEPGTSGVTWVLDPIDGTVNYLYGIPAYAVSVAAVTGGLDPASWTVLAGCVHAVVDGRTWTAGQGHGAFLDGRRLERREDRGLDGALLGTGFGYTADRRRHQAEIVAALLPRVRDIRRMGSAAMDLCTVGSGGLDVYYERGLNPWDMAAGMLVASEAGAEVIGLRGEGPGLSMTVAGPRTATRELAEFLAARDADRDAG
ncbi:inositol monophosphatase family protein [Actinotalea sp.]|uniref:inositol monophosphatase family protein n=1 Tax=Actinotalea sp. TaxID=1872145 RepID=UPI00356A964E